MELLRFSRVHSYAQHDFAITVPVTLRSGDREVDLVASVDTGAAFCLFERAYAEILGLDVETGARKWFTTANSRFEAYGHEVTMQVLGIETFALVYFFGDPVIRKNVLGRRGWIDRLRLGLVDYEQKLYVAPYDDQPSGE